MRYLDLYMESLSKTAFSGENFYPGLAFISFSYQSETGQSSSILPVLTKSKLTIQKALKISKQNINWWYTAWKTLFQRVEKDNKEDLLHFHFVNILTTLKNKESIWIIPHADTPAINKFFVSVGLKLKSLYSFHATNKDPFLGKINYAIFIKKNFSSEKILDTIGEDSLKKFYHILNNKDYEGDIKQAILSKVGTNSNEFLEDIASFFESDVEQTVLNLFQSHSPFSKLSKATPEEIETHQSELNVTSHDIEAANDENNSEEVNSEPSSSNTTTKKEETPNETTSNNSNAPVNNLSKPKEEQPNKGIENEETPVETLEELVSLDVIKKQEKSISSLFHISKSSSFRKGQEKKLTTLLEDKKDERDAIIDYTSAYTYTISNKFLSTSYVQQRFFNNLELDLYSKLPSGELKSKLSNEQKNGIALYINSSKIFNVAGSKPFFELTKVKKTISLMLNVLSEKDATFNEDALVMRGVPVVSNDLVFDTDMWLRNPSLPDSSNTFGLFQRALFLEIQGKTEEETINILSKYYRVGKEVSSEAFLSTSLDLNIANDFSLNNNQLGHLLLIKVPRGNPAIYVDKISFSRGEEEVILFPSTKLKLISVKIRKSTESLYSIDHVNNLYHSPYDASPFALIFIFEVVSQEFSKEKIIERITTFWDNIFSIFT